MSVFNTTMVFGTISILDNLLNLSKFRKFYKKYYKKELSDNYSKGYAFTISFAIYNFIEHVLMKPSILDLPRNELMERARFYGVPFNRMPCQSKTGKFIRNLSEINKEFLSVENWNDIKKVKKIVTRYLLKPLKKTYIKNFEIDSETKENISKKELLSVFSMFEAYIYFNDIHHVRVAYNYAYDKKTVFSQFIKLPNNLKRQNFFEGYKISIDYLWFCLLGNSYRNYSSLNRIHKAKTWKGFDKSFHKIRDEIIQKLEKKFYILSERKNTIFKKQKYDKEFFKEITKKLIKKTEGNNIEEKIDEVFMWYPVRIVCEELSINCSIDFSVALKGVLDTTKDEKIKVIRFIHPEDSGNLYSFAILIRGFGLISDYSHWWLFWDFATDFSGTGGLAYETVMNEIEKNKRRINLKTIKVSSGYLRKYSKDKYTKELEEGIKSYKINTNEARGKLFELYVSQIFNKRGYKTYPRYKKYFLGKEIDVLAILEKKNKIELIIIECEIPYHEAILKEVEKKISVIKNNLEEIKKDLYLSSKKIEISAIVATPKKVRRTKTSKIKILDHRKLKNLSEKYDFPYKEYLDFFLPKKTKEPTVDEIVRFFTPKYYNK